MARNTRDTAIVDIKINSGEAKKSIKDLTADFRDLQKSRREALKAGNLEQAGQLKKR